jgi:hypothetical protein
MRNIIFGCILVLTIYSCNTAENRNSTPFNDNLLWGEWRLDSVSNGISDFQTLFISKDHRFKLFSYSLGNELIFYGCYKNKKLFNQYDTEYQIIQLDSNMLVLNDELNETQLFYKKSFYNKPEERLKQAIKGDKLRLKVLGWWKYKKTLDDSVLYYPKSFLYNSFIMHVREDGKVEIFENFKTQPSLLFSYGVYENHIQLQDRCIITNLDIIAIEANKLIICPIRDTLELQRITEFN